MQPKCDLKAPIFQGRSVMHKYLLKDSSAQGRAAIRTSVLATKPKYGYFKELWHLTLQAIPTVRISTVD
jgi:hypothetical protein